MPPERRGGYALRAGGCRGFTMLELLVVVFIVGVISALGAIAAWPNEAANAEKEARRLAALLELALLESRASGARLAWSHEQGGYTFWQRVDGGDWTRFPAGSPLAQRKLAGAVELRAVRIDARELPHDARIVLSAYGLPGTLEARFRGGGAEYVLRGGLLGRVSVERLHAG